MGVLTDAPAPVASRGGEGQKFVDLFWSLDDDDRAMICRWDADPLVSVVDLHRRIRSAGFDIGRSSVERGLARLRAAQWES